jgi:hypothetical protein
VGSVPALGDLIAMRTHFFRDDALAGESEFHP